MQYIISKMLKYGKIIFHCNEIIEKGNEEQKFLGELLFKNLCEIESSTIYSQGSHHKLLTKIEWNFDTRNYTE